MLRAVPDPLIPAGRKRRSPRPRGWSAYPGRVRTQRQVVDYALQRKALLAEVHSGRVSTMDVCDANPYLLRAAKFHGVPSDVTCPVCRKEPLTKVAWVYGDELKHASGSARAPALPTTSARRPTTISPGARSMPARSNPAPAR